MAGILECSVPFVSLLSRPLMLHPWLEDGEGREGTGTLVIS